MSQKIRVMIVDDSVVVRKMLEHTLNAQPDMQVVGMAADPVEAREVLLRSHPDVMTLDVEMPKLDGLSFLRALMKHQPMPVVMVSAVTERGSQNALAAMDAGAVEIIPKPHGSFSVDAVKKEIVEAIRRAAKAPVRQRQSGAKTNAARAQPQHFQGHQIVAIASSTGGTQALTRVLSQLPKNTPPLVIVQHIQAAFCASFAARLKKDTELDVREGSAGEVLLPGMVRVAPPDIHMIVEPVAHGGFRTVLRNGPRVCFQRPAGDVLLTSVARAAARAAVGVVLTGMGADGAEGLLAMRTAGARTIAQDEASSVVYGMPREAVQLGAAQHVVPLERMAQTIVELLVKPRAA
ncbi:MAG TPA: chemotaxis response regulator protein-glutamate methylesterase [Polyangiaceae bacterium]|nr:chemotaxis response regulator protein-glutamate methylesterase [Polyangiaceae bacterium]